MLFDDGDTASKLAAAETGDLAVVEHDVALSRCPETCQETDERGFARSVRTDQPERLARFYRDRDAIDDDLAAGEPAHRIGGDHQVSAHATLLAR
ncbi:hypothetical protein D3C71_1968800 [compost metagenome]